MKGYYVAEEGHVVNILPPKDINGGAQTSDWFNVKKYGHVSIILTLGVTGGASTVTVKEADSNSGGNSAAIKFNAYKEETAAGDTLGAKVAVAAAGFATSTNDSITYVIEIDASQLSDGKPYLALLMSDPSSATLASAVAVLSGSRYAEETSPTAIT